MPIILSVFVSSFNVFFFSVATFPAVISPRFTAEENSNAISSNRHVFMLREHSHTPPPPLFAHEFLAFIALRFCHENLYLIN